MGLEKLQRINTLLSNAQALISAAHGESPLLKDYTDLQQGVLKLELANELEKLHAFARFAVTANEEECKAKFKALCAEREKQNSNTYLSYSALPESTCNTLYWDLANVLFEPKSLSEMLAIIMPSVRQVIKVEFVVENSKKINDGELKLERQPLDKLDPIEINNSSVLGQFVVAGDLIFDTRQIDRLPFELHRKLYLALEEFPHLKKELYHWSDDLNRLEHDITLVERCGLTPFEAIGRLVKSLTLGGERYTGQEQASIAAKKSYEYFKEYLRSLPNDFYEALQPLKDSRGFTFASVMEDLRRGECGETAAAKLKGIIVNPANKNILLRRPELSESVIQEIQQRYSRSVELSTTGFSKVTGLPALLRQSLFKKITLTTIHDYLDFLLALPSAEYRNFFEHVTIASKPEVLESLAKTLGSKDYFFDHDQVSAFVKCVVELKEKFGGLEKVLQFLVLANQGDELRKELQSLPKEERLALRREDHLLHLVVSDSDLEVIKILLEFCPDKDKLVIDPSILHSAARNPNPEVIEFFLAFYPSAAERLTAVKKENDMGGTVLHCAAHNPNPVVMTILLALYPEADRLAAVIGNKKDRVWGEVASWVNWSENPGMLAAILNSLPPSDRSAVAKNRDEYGGTNLHVAASLGDSRTLARENAESLKIFLALCFSSPEERLAAVNEKDRWNERTVWHVAAKNRKLEIVQTLLTYPELLAGVNEKDRDGCTAWHYAAGNENPEVIQTLLTYPELLAGMNEKDGDGRTAWHYAVRNKNPKVFKALLVQTTSLRGLIEKDRYGRTVWHGAAENENPEVIQTLLAYPDAFARTTNTPFPYPEFLAGINEKDRYGRSVWHVAAENKNPEMLTTLLMCSGRKELEVPIEEKDSDGHSVLYHAAYNRNRLILQGLLKTLPELKPIYAEHLKEQYEKQKSQRAWRTFFIVLAAIVLTPLSLLISIPLWFWAKNRDPIQELVTTPEQYTGMKKQRNRIQDKPEPTTTITPSKKPLIASVGNQNTYLVDRFALERFNMFATAKGQPCSAAALKASKEKSWEVKRLLFQQ